MEQYLSVYPLANSHSGSTWIHVCIHSTFIKKIYFISIVATGDDGSTSLKEIHSKTVASAFWNHQVEAELRERGWEEYLFVSSSSREDCMKKIDEERAKSIYPHHESNCSEECKQRGKLYIINIGNWVHLLCTL